MLHSEIVSKVREWLGQDGMDFFRHCKEKFGTVSPCWMEGGKDDPNKTAFANAIDKAQFPGIPHPVHFREGMTVRNFLRTITDNAWTAHEYDNRWADIIEDAIKEK